MDEHVGAPAPSNAAARRLSFATSRGDLVVTRASSNRSDWAARRERYRAAKTAYATICTRKRGRAVGVQGIRTWGVAAPIEAKRFAGASHLLVEISYHRSWRVVEPCSLRRPQTGNLPLYAFEQSKNGAPTNDIRPYKIAEIQDVRVLQRSFVPRYAIELTERAGVWRW